MSLITTNDGRIVLKKAQSMMAVPYVYDNTLKDYVLGENVYDISAIIGDTIVIEQAEGNTETKNNEFIGAPLLECVSGGKYNFTAQCIDLQNNVLASMFGALMNDSGSAAFRDDYILIYALIRIRFTDENTPDVFLPKVQLNSRLYIQQLKTRLGQGNIGGTALARNVGVKNTGGTGLTAFNSIYSNGTYTPFTPVILVPQGRVPLFYRSKHTETLDYYSSINFNTGVVTNDIDVKPSDGTLPIPGGGGGEGGGEGGGGNA